MILISKYPNKQIQYSILFTKRLQKRHINKNILEKKF